MNRVQRTFVAVLAVVVLPSGLGALGSAGASAAPNQSAAGNDRLDVYVGKLDLRQLAELRASGIDPHEIAAQPTRGAEVDVEVVLSGEQAEALAEEGVELAPKEIDGQTAAELSTLQAAEGYTVYRTYSEPGGIKDEIEQAAADNPAITKLVTIGQSVQGKDILALKVTNRATQTKDGRRPATLFSARSTPGSGSPPR